MSNYKTNKLGKVLFFTERKNIGDFVNSAMESINYTFVNSSDLNSDTKRKWMCCHAINSVREQQVYCSQNGVMTPPSNLNMWLTNANANGRSLSSYASAPMLKQMANSSLILGVAQLSLVATGHPWAEVSIQVLKQFPPDVTYNYSQDESFYINSDQISEIFYHELAHASHYRKVGSSYWTPYISYIVQNKGYGEPKATGSGRIAISEAWAYFCGERFAHLRYGNNNSLTKPNPGNWLNSIENFTPFAGTSSWNWIPNGVMHDLTDSGEPSSLTNVTDIVNGYSISQCFGSMDSDITSVTSYKNRFISEYGIAQQTNINTLFKDYGY